MTKKILLISFVLLLIISSLTGCYAFEYNGDNPELFTVAIYNFLGSVGYGSNGEIPIPAEAETIETDSFGRVLFYYHEGIGDEGCGYGILQKSEEGYAYYYEDDCILCADDEWLWSGDVTHDDWFSEEELAAFKTRNDWEQPINEKKCTKKLIVSKKPKEKLKLKEKDFDKAAKAYCKANGIGYTEDSVHRYDTFFMADDYGREMYLMYCYVSSFKGSTESFFLALIFNPDGSCTYDTAALRIEDLNDYTEAMKEFKQNNGWNTEYKTE